MDFSTRVDAPLLSIIIPAYNEESRLPATLEEITGFLQKQAYSYEVLIIENGSSDRTLEIAQAFAQRFSFVYAYHETERGKGLAVRAGMLKASGQYRFICDADLSMPISEVNRFIPPLNAHHGVVIASREAPGAVRHNEPHYRHVTGRLFNWVVHILALPGLNDTQCGFKCFYAPVAEEIFPLQTIGGWTFDVEVLYIARRRGYTVSELPIHWYYNAESKVNILKDLRHVVGDLLTIRMNALRGVYDAAPAKN